MAAMPIRMGGSQTAVSEGDLLWTPGAQMYTHSNLRMYMNWLAAHRQLHFDTYAELWQWSVQELEDFWQSIWDYYQVEASSPARCVLEARIMPGAQWFSGARINYAQHILRNERSDRDALLYQSETQPLTGMSWTAFAGQVRIVATQLRKLGVQPGDRVIAYLPNIPQTVIVMLATTAIGALWVSCPPEFGARGVLDRVMQLDPTVLFCADGYRYGGKNFDRSRELREIITQLPTLQCVVFLPCLDAHATPPCDVAISWSQLLDHPAVPAEQFQFEQVLFDHPLWILFSSGTTGLPKAIVHGHGGILLELYKLLGLQMDLHRDDRVLFYTTTGWMMWNFLVSSLLCGACPVLYDGNPAYPEIDALWKLADESRASLFGASPSYVDIMAKAGVVPGAKYEFAQLRCIMPAGSPVTAAHTAWFYDNVKRDLWVATGSGGTDCCTGFVGGVAILPVYAGEIQAPSLGIAVKAFNAQGHSVIDEVGELVITQPIPSMPLYFWGDTNNRRYLETYFNEFPGVWRHGDFFRINARGGCFVLGRSDATLNRYGVRIGTAEIYRALTSINEINDALIVNLDLPGGRFFMPLFVQLKGARQLDAGLESRIRNCLRREYTPRHVPDRIIAVPAIPCTLTGKKMEVPVRKLLLGLPLDQVVNRNAMANPQALDFFVDYVRHQTDYQTEPT
jgi:acetoacetyl-CoA synthetase